MTLTHSMIDTSDFLALLEESLAAEQPERGDLINGIVMAIDPQGLIVDCGMKRDGIVPRADMERMGNITYHVGDEIAVMVLQLEDQEGNLILSVSQARQGEDWTRAEALMASAETWEGDVQDANRGGLIIPFGNLRGFVPASHVSELPRGIGENERKDYLSGLIGKKIPLKVIEVNRKRRRLVFSQREAQRGRRDSRKESLIVELHEGEIRRGVVSGLRDFGAFVDLGGADGLIHISELAWHRVKHPRELLTVGQEVEVFILRLDQDGKRIGLSLKRMQQNPWSQVDELYHVGQLVEGTISRVTQFGAFVSLEPGIEALLHTSQMADPVPEDPTQFLRDSQHLLMRIITIETHRQRLGLSLKDVSDQDREQWTADHGTELVTIPTETVAADAGQSAPEAVELEA